MDQVINDILAKRKYLVLGIFEYAKLKSLLAEKSDTDSIRSFICCSTNAIIKSISDSNQYSAAVFTLLLNEIILDDLMKLHENTDQFKTALLALRQLHQLLKMPEDQYLSMETVSNFCLLIQIYPFDLKKTALWHYAINRNFYILENPHPNDSNKAEFEWQIQITSCESNMSNIIFEYSLSLFHNLINTNEYYVIVLVSFDNPEPKSLFMMLVNLLCPWMSHAESRSTRCFHQLKINCRLSDTAFSIASERLRLLSDKFYFDYGILLRDQYETSKKLIVFDMDSTLIKEETIDELGKIAGKSKEIEAITRDAMNGKIDFSQSLKSRVALLKGLPSSVWMELQRNIKFSEGVHQVMEALKFNNIHTAVVSGGFAPMTNFVQNELGISTSIANNIAEQDDLLQGYLTGPIIDAAAKRNVLRSLAGEMGCTRNETAAVGDGANDILMLADSGTGIAYKAKPIVRNSCTAHIVHTDMRAICCFLNINENA